MAVKLGLKGKLYYCAAGIGGTPTWILVPKVRDVSVSLSKSEQDASVRGGGGWKATMGALKDADIGFDLTWPSAAAQAFLAAFLADSVIGFAVADEDIETPGTYVFMADCEVLKFDKKEPLDGIQTVAVTVKPTDSDNAPSYEAVEEET